MRPEGAEAVTAPLQRLVRPWWPERKNVSDKQLTPWFDGKLHKPARRGVYMQMSGSGHEAGYQRWNGKVWSSWYSTPELAARAPRKDCASPTSQNDNWRGLLKRA